MDEIIEPEIKHELRSRKDAIPGQFSCLKHGILTQITWVPFGCPFYCPMCGENLSPQKYKVVIL